MTDSRAAEVEALLQRLVARLKQRGDVRALALVGSWACEAPHAGSDVNIVLLTNSPSSYVEHEDWLQELGAIHVIRTLRWGAITERLMAFSGGLELDIGIGTPAWASANPVDAGTWRVVTDGIRILHDPDRLLADLVAAC